MSIVHEKNLTQQNIMIGTFDHKLKFTYAILVFKAREGESGVSIQEQGKIVNEYIKDNYLLVSRNTIMSDRAYSSSLFISWDENFSKIEFELQKLISQNDGVQIQDAIVFNNGKMKSSKYISDARDSGGAYSYLISHLYEDGKYTYTLTSGSSFRNDFEILIGRNGFKKNTVLDLVFTGRVSNEHNNCYGFDNYKIKDYYPDANGGFVLANKDGLVDLSMFGGRGVVLLNFLPDWKDFTTITNYYSGMDISIFNFIPEKNIEIRKNQSDKIFYNGHSLIERVFSKRIILAEDPEERDQLIKIALNSGMQHSFEQFLRTHCIINKEDVLKEFCERNMEATKKRIQEEKSELKYAIAQTALELKELNEQIAYLEYRTKDFIPMPEIRLPKDGRGEFFNAFSLLKMENGKYVIEKEGE